MGLTRLRAEQISDIDYKQAVRVISVTDITLSGGAPSQVDGVNVSTGDRILVNGQSTGSQNGIYEVQTVGSGSNGTWIRSSDTNVTGELEAGAIVMVTEGLTYADTQWKLTTNNPIIIGTTALTFEQNSAFAFGNIFANGTAVLANSVGSTVTFSAGNNILITGNNTSKTVTIGVTGISLTSIANGTSNVNVVSSGGNVTVGVGGTNNIAVFSTGGLDVTGRVTATGNVTGSNLITAGLITATGNIDTGNVRTAGLVTATGNITGGNILTAGLVSATGNVNGGNLNVTGNIVDTGALSIITGSNGNIALTPNGTGIVTVSSALSATGNLTAGNVSATNLTGTLLTAAQTNITSVGTLGSLSVTGNVDGGNIRTVGLISATGNVTGGNIRTAGVVSATGDIFAKELWSTQSSGDEGGQVNLGIPAANTALTGQVTIDVYQNRLRFFQGDGARGAYIDLTQANVGVGTNLLAGGGGGTPGGADTNVQFNDAGVFGGNGQFVYNKVTNVLTVGSISANTNGAGTNYAVGDDAYIGDINVVNTISIRGQQNAANGYIVFGNADSTALGRAGSGPLTYAGAFSATGNITGGNLSGTNIVGTLTTAAQTNITSIGTLSALSVTGNVQGGNIRTAGLISATGNITGGNLLINGSAVITGNLNVQGTETIFNVANLTVNDKDIIVANNVTGGANVDGAGIQAGNPATATWFFNNATTSWQSNISITPTANGTLSLGGASNYWGNAFLTTATVIGNVQGGNLRTAGLISAAGNITGGNVSATNLTGTLLTAAQTNITSVGTLTSLNSGAISSSGNVTGANILTGGLISATGNLTAGNVSATNLTGTLLTAAQTNITSVGTLSALSVTGNVQGGNITTAGLISATGTITSAANVVAGNISTSGLITATGNVTGGNISTAGLISVTGNVQGGNLRTAGLISATGNVTGGNILTGGLVSSTGNITGGNILGNGAGLTGINAFSNVTVTGGNSAVADSIADTLTLTAGSGIAIVVDSATDTITIAAAGGSEIFVDGADFGTVVEPVTESDDLGLVTDAVTAENDLGQLVVSGLIYPDQFVLPGYTTSTLPAASPAGAMIYVTNESGGAVPAFADGTNWRRVTDRAIVT
jgi:hypothetical protein